jgi:hypothetical protein
MDTSGLLLIPLLIASFIASHDTIMRWLMVVPKTETDAETNADTETETETNADAGLCRNPLCGQKQDSNSRLCDDCENYYR